MLETLYCIALSCWYLVLWSDWIGCTKV